MTVLNAPASADTVVRAVHTVSDQTRHRWIRFWVKHHAS